MELVRDGETLVLSTADLGEIATLQIVLRTAVMGADSVPDGGEIAALARGLAALLVDLFPELNDPKTIRRIAGRPRLVRPSNDQS